MQRHPTKFELLGYAECSISGRPIPAQVGAHVARCRPCWDEVEAMRQTLWTAAVGAGLEPSRNFTAGILMAAKTARAEESRRLRRKRSVVGLAKGVGYAAALVLVSAVWFGASSRPAAPADTSAALPVELAAAPVPSPEEFQQAAARIQPFAAAVNASNTGAVSLRALQQRRLARVLDAELDDALVALERNPGCARAGGVVTVNLQRQAQTWKELYLESSL